MEGSKLRLCSLIREMLVLVIEEWGQTWRWGSNIQKVDGTILAFQQLFDVTALEVQDATKVDWPRLLEQVKHCNAWCTLKEITSDHGRKSRPALDPRKEFLPHVQRSGKVSWTQQERGGRRKPGEATSAAGADTPLAPTAVIDNELPKFEEEKEEEEGKEGDQEKKKE